MKKLLLSALIVYVLCKNLCPKHFISYCMTTWPSGLRRVTRNHFSSGGVGSNPAVVAFYIK